MKERTTKTIRIDKELHEFLRTQMDPMIDTMDTILKKLLPNPKVQIFYGVGSILFDEIESAYILSQEVDKPIIYFQKLS